jgi:type IV pilus assembly protein PilC
VRGKDVTTFTRQLSTLTDAGIAIVRSLNILEHQMRPCALKNVVAGVSAEVEGGSTLSEAMSRHPKAFDELYSNMVKAGEAGGVLDVVLQRLADFREKSARLRRRVISAMIYPAAVITFATAILVGIIIWIIPSFMEMFEDLDVDLPTPTRIMLAISDFVVAYWYLLPAVPVGIYVLFKLIGKTKTGRYVLDWLTFNVPIFGKIMRKGAIARFTRTFGTLIASGVPILEALTISRDTAGNSILAGALRDVHDSIREGETIAAPLAQTRICDDMVVNMIDVGEETGNLDTMLSKIADNYDEQVDVAVEGMRSLLEPVMVISLGVIVGFIVISLFLPLVKLIESLS